jgi:glutamine synthetase
MAKTATASATDIIETWRADGIRYVRFELPDMHGTSRTKIVPIAQAAGYCAEGLNMYGGAAVLDSRSDVVPNTLYHEEIGYGDQRLIPDPETAAVVPWAEATARFICDSQFVGGEPLRALPRHVFRRQLERCREMGFEPVLGFEPEFYLLDQSGSPLFGGHQIFNSVRNTYVPMITELIDHMNAFGIEIITANCEYAPSQWEINFRPGAGMAGPDNAFSFKNATKEIAFAHGLNATFMSKPFADSAGSGCHAHVSLTSLDGGENVFGDDSDPQGMTDTCRRFMAGQLRHARGIYTLLAPTVNCLKRRRPHTFSPSNVSWGPEDRTAFLRIKGGSAGSRHIENRAPTGLSNPYLVGAAMLAAGLNGIEEELELEPAAATPAEEDASKEPLPTTMQEGLAGLESDANLVEALGQDFVSAYTVMRRYEMQRFDDHVTDWERQEYTEVF